MNDIIGIFLSCEARIMETKVRFVRQALSAAVWVESAGRVDFSGLRIEAFILIPGPRGAPFHPCRGSRSCFLWFESGRFVYGRYPLHIQPVVATSKPATLRMNGRRIGGSGTELDRGADGQSVLVLAC
jgi:hypothetical protein